MEGIKAGLPKRTLVLFLALLTIGSAVLQVLLIRAGGIQHAGGIVAGVMAVPGLSALLAILLTTGKLKGLGWRLGRWRYLGWALLAPLAIVTPVYLIGFAGGLSELHLDGWSRVARLNFGVQLGALASLGLICSLGLLINSVVAAGEELGWRGFLFPELARRMSPANAALVTGAIWAVWHYAGILFGGYRELATPLAFNLVCFTVMVIGWSMVAGWLRQVSGSVWPAVLMHAAHNLLIQAVLPAVLVEHHGAKYLTSEFGAGVAIAYAIAGLIAYRALDAGAGGARGTARSALAAAA